MKPSNIDKLAELVTLIKEGDEEAFVEIYSQMFQKIYFLAISIVKDEYLAQDVVQETFIIVYKNIRDLKDNRMFTAWVNRIAYYESLRIINNKKEMPVERLPEELELDSRNDGNPLDIILSNVANSALMDCILSLPPEYKTTLLLRYYAELKLDEIAAAMECSVGTVKSRLSRSKTALRKRLGSESRMLPGFVLGSLVLAASMRSTIKVYAAECSMSPAMAGKALAAIQQQTGISAAATAFSTNGGVTAFGAKIAAMLTMGGIATIGASALILQGAQISVTGNTGIYTNQNLPIQVEVETVVASAIQSVCLIDQETQSTILLSEEKEQTYQAEIEHNGSYLVELKLANGKTVRQKFKVSRIDKEKPKLYWYSWDITTGLFYGLVKDDLAGINFENSYTEDTNGTRSQLNAYEEDTGKIEFLLPEDITTMTLYDRAGNKAIYEIAPHMNEAE